MIVGYTTGAFDLFHIGHVNLLRNARALCDYLIVGVSTDELLRECKREPVIPFADRVEIVRACRYADAVIPQATREKREAVERLKPDFLFVGDDWYGRYPGEGLGVRIIYLPYTQGISTSLLIERTGHKLSWAEAMDRNLFDMADVLEGLGMAFWLEGGTLLGAIRDGEYPVGDHDIDLSTWMDSIRIYQLIIQEATACGFVCDDQFGPPGAHLQFCRFGLQLDLWFKTREGENAWWYVPRPDRTMVRKQVPAYFYDLLTPYSFHGRTFNAPADSDGYLAYRYGDWRTVVPDGQYDGNMDDGAIAHEGAGRE